ncbi:phosphatase PAP2 family protein [soil metagenome]
MTPTDPGRSRVASQHPKLYFVTHVLAGVVFTAALLWGFASIADAVGDNGRIAGADAGLTRWIQTHDTEWGEKLFSAVSLLGAPVLVALIAITAVAYARRRDWLRAWTLALATASGAGLNVLLKYVFHRGRPEYATEFITHASWSFPSGHAMNSIVGYGMLLALILHEVRHQVRRRLLAGATAILIIAIGISRVYLGVHYLTDVLAGWLAGGAWLLVCVTAYRFAKRRRGHPAS